MKRILVLAAAAVGALAFFKKQQDDKAERELWAEVTDDVSTS
ncbi:MAG: DLW-39 family protein [Ornithinimicrobium sp.]